MADDKSVLRSIVSFGVAEARNGGLEEAANMLERRAAFLTRPQSRQDFRQEAHNLRQLATDIRARKSSAQSHLAEAKVGCGKIGGLLPAPESKATSDYISDRVFDGTRPLSQERTEKLRANYERQR